MAHIFNDWDTDDDLSDEENDEGTVNVQGKRKTTKFTKTEEKKSVRRLSTMHKQPDVEENGRKKPSMILFYNINKVGVDSVDQMLRLYSTHRSHSRVEKVADGSVVKYL